MYQNDSVMAQQVVTIPFNSMNRGLPSMQATVMPTKRNKVRNMNKVTQLKTQLSLKYLHQLYSVLTVASGVIDIDKAMA